MKLEQEKMFIIRLIFQVKILHSSLQSIQIIFLQQSLKTIFWNQKLNQTLIDLKRS